MFLIAAAVARSGFVITWFLEERPLRDTVAEQGIGDSFAAPRETTSIDELETMLSNRARKQYRNRFYEHLGAQAPAGLDASETWLLLRLHEQAIGDADTRKELIAGGFEPIVLGLRRRSLVEPASEALTPAGEQTAAQLADLGRERRPRPDQRLAARPSSRHRRADPALHQIAGLRPTPDRRSRPGVSRTYGSGAGSAGARAKRSRAHRRRTEPSRQWAT